MMRAALALAIVPAMMLAAPAHAEPGIEGTYDGYYDSVIVELPRCHEEDGSDMPYDTCAWIDPDTGSVYINPAPTARGPNAFDGAAYVGGWN